MDDLVIIDTFKNFLVAKTEQKLLDEVKAGQDVELDKLGLTSLNMVEISMELEEKFGLENDIEDFDSCKTMSDFIACCKTKIA
jgi:acyl carrier protein